MQHLAILIALVLGSLCLETGLGAKWKAEKIVQREAYEKLLESVRTGAEMGLTECKQQFKNNKWNCSTTLKSNSLPHMATLGVVTVKQATKETAFFHSISAAGVTYSLTRDCRKGMFENCACQQSKRKSALDWSGCNDDVRFGEVLARHFLDKLRKRGKARTVITLHNYAVGRKAVKATLNELCKCHGVSGSCSTRSCWKSMASFAAVGDYLREKYQNAKKVRVENNKLVEKLAPKLFIALERKDRSLVFLKSFPDYCHPNAAIGSAGVLGRKCSSDSPYYAKCSELCTSCGFKMDKKLIIKSYKCNCKFVWCCDVKCSMCKKLVAVGTCRRG